MKEKKGCYVSVTMPQMSDEFQKNAKTISLIMRKENAQLIKNGVKNVEFREYTQFYHNMLIAKDRKESLLQSVNKITFRNYNKSFEMTVSVKTYGIFIVQKDFLELIKKDSDKLPFSDFSCKEVEQIVELNKEFINNNADDPMMFYFIIDKVESVRGLD